MTPDEDETMRVGPWTYVRSPKGTRNVWTPKKTLGLPGLVRLPEGWSCLGVFPTPEEAVRDWIIVRRAEIARQVQLLNQSDRQLLDWLMIVAPAVDVAIAMKGEAINP